MSGAQDLAIDFSPRPELERVLRRCTELLGCDAGSICSVDEAAGTYRKEADLGVACQSGQVFPLTEGMTGTVVARRGPVWFDRYDQVPGGHVADPERATLRGVIGVPLEWCGRVIGACIVFSRDSCRVFGPSDAELLELFARHEAIVLATARLREAAEVTARTEAVAVELSRAAGRLRQASRDAMDALAEARLALLGLAPAALHAPLAGGSLAPEAPVPGAAVGGPRVRTLIAAHRPLLRAGIARLLSSAAPGSDGRVEIVGEATSADAALAACRELRPDVVLADLGLTAPLLSQLPELAVVGLCDDGDERLVAGAMRGGACGCVDTWRTARSLPGQSSPRPAAGRSSLPRCSPSSSAACGRARASRR